jgi:NYN domain
MGNLVSSCRRVGVCCPQPTHLLVYGQRSPGMGGPRSTDQAMTPTLTLRQALAASFGLGIAKEAPATCSTLPRMTQALLIDGENLSSRHAPRICAEVPPDCAVRQVFGDTARLNGWMQVPWLTAVHVAPARNAADIALAVRAMDLALARGFTGFTIATSDSGLASLVTCLREAGRNVTVAGEAKTAPALRAAAHRFIELPSLAEPVAALPAPETPLVISPPQPCVTLKGLSPLDRFVRETISKEGAKGLMLTDVNIAVQKGPGTSIATLPEKTWRAWFVARPHLFTLDPRGPNARVRLTRGA